MNDYKIAEEDLPIISHAIMNEELSSSNITSIIQPEPITLVKKNQNPSNFSENSIKLKSTLIEEKIDALTFFCNNVIDQISFLSEDLQEILNCIFSENPTISTLATKFYVQLLTFHPKAVGLFGGENFNQISRFFDLSFNEDLEEFLFLLFTKLETMDDKIFQLFLDSTLKETKKQSLFYRLKLTCRLHEILKYPIQQSDVLKFLNLLDIEPSSIPEEYLHQIQLFSIETLFSFLSDNLFSKETSDDNTLIFPSEIIMSERLSQILSLFNPSDEKLSSYIIDILIDITYYSESTNLLLENIPIIEFLVQQMSLDPPIPSIQTKIVQVVIHLIIYCDEKFCPDLDNSGLIQLCLLSFYSGSFKHKRKITKMISSIIERNIHNFPLSVNEIYKTAVDVTIDAIDLEEEDLIEKQLRVLKSLLIRSEVIINRAMPIPEEIKKFLQECETAELCDRLDECIDKGEDSASIAEYIRKILNEKEELFLSFAQA